MANFQNGINITGSTSYINIYATTENTSSLGNLWWDGNNLSFSGYVSSFSAGSQLISSKNTSGGTGTLNAALAFGGRCQSPYQVFTCTEEYNGSSWSAGGYLITGRGGLAGAGTQNAGLALGGTTSAGPTNPSNAGCTEEYDGSSWSAGGALITARRCLGGAGTQTAGLGFGGVTNQTQCYMTCTEDYNGSSWTAGGNKISASGVGRAGTQNAALAMGGYYFGALSCTEEYNGTSWATGGSLNNARRNFSSFGTQNSAVAAGGNTSDFSHLSSIENYNGTSWAEGSTLPSLATCSAGTGANSNSGLIIGGCQNPTNTIVIAEVLGKKIIK